MAYNDHIVQLPKAIWIIKIVQTVIAVLVLAFSAFEVAVYPNSVSGYDIFVALYTIAILVYYFVALHGSTKIYNWIALLVLECVAVIFWLCVWALFATSLAALALYDTYYNDYAYGGYYSYIKRDSLAKRYDYNTAVAAGALVYTTLAISVIQFILYCVTLGFMGKGIHHHRKAGRPMNHGGSGTSAWGASTGLEKHDMQSMASAPA
ncbi:hypothetical protein LTR37_002792 [Vermiconidia calcicola]|uniref:Uncharacterized protein n=1 Tax=Vermiconidia calcicola TaxID=1690605 RepID=A0ACC3NSE8_9PEZI|nr:hypothetical protein LTR37_002792 [Vermiconidia calcicola]